MAKNHSSRRIRRRREGESRRLSRPSPAAIHTTSASGALDEIRGRLQIVRAVTVCACAALTAQRADHDLDAAMALQRCVVDELDRQIECLAALQKQGAPERFAVPRRGARR